MHDQVTTVRATADQHLAHQNHKEGQRAIKCCGPNAQIDHWKQSCCSRTRTSQVLYAMLTVALVEAQTSAANAEYQQQINNNNN